MTFNYIPFFGWFVSFVGNVSLAIPFWFCWTYLELGRIYFDFVPKQYHTLPFWHCVGLFMIVAILKNVLVPKLASVTQNNK